MLRRQRRRDRGSQGHCGGGGEPDGGRGLAQWQDDRPARGRACAAPAGVGETVTGKPEDVLDWLKPGQRVYFQGGPGECSVFRDLLAANPEAAEGVELWSCLIP